MRLRKLALATAALAAGMMTSYALAQERPIVEGARETVRGARDAVRELGPRRVTANRPAESSATNPDHTIAQCLAISNQEEIALGTLAAGKTQNPQVKQFAEMLAKDHGKLAADLEKFGATPVDLAAVHGPQNTNDSDASAREARTAERRERRDARDATADQATEQRTAARLDFIDVKRQMAQRCLENARQCWNEKSDNEADMAFVGSQLVLHQQMIDAQEVLKPYASAELQQIIDQGIERSRAHLAHAKQLIDELADHTKGAPEKRSEG
jgi:predicted outer membrane protein